MHVATRTDIPEIESIIWHPEVAIASKFDGSEQFDAADFMAGDGNFILMVNGGCFILHNHGNFRYECHTNFLPGFRGANASMEAAKALRYAFTCSDVCELVTKVPDVNRPALMLAKAVGFRRLFSRKDAWIVNGMRSDMGYYMLDADDWIAQGTCRKSGQTFHMKLHDRFPAMAHHERDDIHDCYVGAASDMIMAGRIDKGIFFYNRWAMFAGYATIERVSDEPLILDARDFLIKADGDGFAFQEK